MLNKNFFKSNKMRYQSAIFDRLTYYSAYGGVADYCDEHVCLSVRLSVCLSVRDHISGNTRPIFTKFFIRVTYGRGSVLLC